MRVAPHRRRRWNNILILIVILFIAVLNLPTFIKTYLMDPPANPSPFLLNPEAKPQAMHFPMLSLEENQGRWRSTPPTAVAPEELVARWKNLQGTEVNEDTYQSFIPILHNPETIEVWYYDQEEPQRITYYQTPRFWLFKNWQDKWIAISVEKGYLLPEK